MKTKYWIAVFAAVLVICLGLSVLLLLPGEPAGFAEVYSEGKLLYTLDLSENREVTVSAEKGSNVITVRDGKVAVTQADCPDGHCMQRGYCNSGVQIVCLPHELVIRFTGEPAVDGVA